MLAYILALAVGFGSLSLYLSAFLFPEIYRKYDLLWSGLGLFYALVLWICAGRVTGSLLLGQMAIVVLLGGLGWQTLNMRFCQTPVEQRIRLQGDSLPDALQDKFVQVQAAFADGSWRTYVANVVDRFPAQSADLARTLQGWIEALISTTLRPQEFSVEQNSSSEIADLAKNSNLTEKNLTEKNLTEKNIEKTEATQSDRSLSLTPQVSLADRVDSANLNTSTEFAAEWDELEPEVHPELETIDGVGWDFQAPPPQRQATDAQARPKTPEENSDPRE